MAGKYLLRLKNYLVSEKLKALKSPIFEIGYKFLSLLWLKE